MAIPARGRTRPECGRRHGAECRIRLFPEAGAHAPDGRGTSKAFSRHQAVQRPGYTSDQDSRGSIVLLIKNPYTRLQGSACKGCRCRLQASLQVSGLLFCKNADRLTTKDQTLVVLARGPSLPGKE
jgi:hypothetical protein